MPKKVLFSHYKREHQKTLPLSPHSYRKLSSDDWKLSSHLENIKDCERGKSLGHHRAESQRGWVIESRPVLESKYLVNMRKCLSLLDFPLFSGKHSIDAISIPSLTQIKFFCFWDFSLVWSCNQKLLEGMLHLSIPCMQHIKVCTQVTWFELRVILRCQTEFSLKPGFNLEDLNLK